MTNTSLQTFLIKKMNELGLSGYQIERRSGGAITQSYFNRIKNGEVRDPSISKLKAIARGMGIAEHEIIAAASDTDMSEQITHSRLASINFAYDGMPQEKRHKADYLIELLDREIHRIENEL